MLSVVLMPLNVAMRPMSISTAGEATRSFMAGTKLCPPAKSLAFSFVFNNWIASATVPGRKYSKLDGYIVFQKLRMKNAELRKHAFSAFFILNSQFLW